MNQVTAYQALSALYSVLEPAQTIEFVYRGGMNAGRQTFSFQVRGKSLGESSVDAQAGLHALKQNMEMALTLHSNLCFSDAQFEVPVLSAKTWRGELLPQGILVSCGQALQNVSQVGSPESVCISPLMPTLVSRDNVVETVLASPQPVEVIVSVKLRSLSETDKQMLKKVLKAIDFGKASYFMLPERRKMEDEERRLLIEPMAQHLSRWLVKTRGLELRCTVHADEAPSKVFLCMLGRALFRQQQVEISCELSNTKLTKARDQVGALDLRHYINASCVVPDLFPHAEQLVNISDIKRNFAPPLNEPSEEGICLGVAGGKETCLTEADRSRHVYIMGATGCGKSTLLYNMLMQDIVAGEGVCLMDPHGDLFDDVLESIPTSRHKDVVLINPCDFEYAVGINFLEITGKHRHVEMGFIVNEMIKIFDRLYNMKIAGGPIFEQYIRNALLLVMDKDSTGTLMDVVRVFEDVGYRNHLKKICKNPLVTSFWQHQAERVDGDLGLKNIAPYITSKLNQFTQNPLMRPIIGQRRSSINFRSLMDDQRIVLVNLSKGLLGELDSQLLGMILISKLFIAAMGRADVDKEQRVPFNWYIDEFQNFATDSMAHLLSESRKYQVRMILANQNMAQLYQNGNGVDIREAVLGNVANLLMFRMGVKDARVMETYTFPELTGQDLQYLPDFHAVARLLKNNAPLKPFVLQTLPKQENVLKGFSATKAKEEILAHSRKHYARPFAEVEKEIFARVQLKGELAEKETLVDQMAHKVDNEAGGKPTNNHATNATFKSSEELQKKQQTKRRTEKYEGIDGISKITDTSKKGLQELHIEQLALSSMVKQGLAKMGIHTVWQLCACGEPRLCANPDFEVGCTDEIIEFLTRNKLTLSLRNSL